MSGLVLKDLLIMRKALRSYLLFLLFYLLLAVLDVFPMAAVTAVTQVVIMMLPLSAFAYDEQTQWTRYAATFPLGRRALVRGRYLFTLLMSLAACLYALSCGGLLALVHRSGWQGMAEAVAAVLVSLGCGLCFADILLPLCYKLGVERARPFMYVILFVPALLLFGGWQLGLLDRLDLSMLERLPEQSFLALTALPPLAGLAGMGVSYRISCGILDHKEL